MSAVDTISEDVAALTHSAFHRLSKMPEIKAMCNSIASAAKNIAADNEELSARAAERVKILQYQWAIYRTNTQWAFPVIRKLRRVAKRFINILR